MERFSTCELRHKEIINLCDGTKIGCPNDFEFNSSEGKITAIIVTKPGGFLWLGRGRDIFIPWEKIDRFGEDVILVRLAPDDMYSTEFSTKRKKK